MKLGLVLAIGVAALAVMATTAQRRAPIPTESASAAASFGQALPAAECPVGSLPDHGVCVPVPKGEPTAAAPREGIGVPRRPERPAELSRYVLPVVPLVPEGSAQGLPRLTGVLPDAVERNLLGIAIPVARGAEVRMVGLEGQQGEATVVYAGDLVGPTLVTRHHVNQRDERREYLLFFGNLAQVPAIDRGTTIKPGAKIGTAGEKLTPGQPRLYLDLRQMQPGFDPGASPPESWLDPANTIAIDVRNALGLAKQPH